jgi:hypothetical protein
MKRRLTALLLILLAASTAYPQTPVATATPAAAEQTKTVFPQWARDLRRGEIIAFGAFPFMMFFSILSVDLYRSATHNWDSRYYPWPVKPPGAIEMDRDEHTLTLGIAIGGSLVIALADHLIIQVKRARAAKQRLDLPEGDLIILRKPWQSEEVGEGEEAPPDQAAEGEADSEGETDSEGEAAP